jgi:hypothetical protein
LSGLGAVPAALTALEELGDTAAAAPAAGLLRQLCEADDACAQLRVRACVWEGGRGKWVEGVEGGGGGGWGRGVSGAVLGAGRGLDVVSACGEGSNRLLAEAHSGSCPHTHAQSQMHKNVPTSTFLVCF